MKKTLTVILALLLLIMLGAAFYKQSSQSVEIKGSADQVWAVLVDVNRWADDNPALKQPKLISGAGGSMGSVVEFYPVLGQLKPMKVRLTVTTSDKNKKLEFKGAVAGLKIVEGFELSEANGMTRLTNYEHARGFTVSLIPQKDIDTEHRQWAESVKRRVEK